MRNPEPVRLHRNRSAAQSVLEVNFWGWSYKDELTVCLTVYLVGCFHSGVMYYTDILAFYLKKENLAAQEQNSQNTQKRKCFSKRCVNYAR